MIKVDRAIIDKTKKLEDASVEAIEKGLEAGHIAIPQNIKRDIDRPCAIGRGLATKINANIGLSLEASSIDLELKKMDVAIAAGADTIMDLSTGPLHEKMRKRIISDCAVPLGTVPVYELACDGKNKFASLKEDDFVDVLQKQAEEGVDFFTIHSGITLEAVRLVEKNPRIMNIVSRGGAFLASWMMINGKENPFYSRFDEIVDIAKKYNIVLSLGDSLRPGAIADATDELQLQELVVLGSLQQRAFDKGVQIIIEGPGHVPMDQIESNVRLQKTICHGAPFYVLGPLVTDAAPGYDHIVGAIGGAIAAWHGADFLCYVTPAEHLRLPDIEDVRQGVMASKIAAHAADIVKGIPSALQRDINISKARAKRDWEKQFQFSLDKELPKRVREGSPSRETDVCTMCSEYCSIKILEENLEKRKKEKSS